MTEQYPWASVVQLADVLPGRYMCNVAPGVGEVAPLPTIAVMFTVFGVNESFLYIVWLLNVMFKTLMRYVIVIDASFWFDGDAV